MNPHPAFKQTEHRPWPVPSGPWVMQQEWLDLLFLHWEITPDALRPYIPQNLEIDTFEGKAWLAVVPFSMKGVAPRGFPKPSCLSDFPEINIRTYVIKDGKPGVWFFSLDVPHRLPVWIARSLFHLPYFRAQMQVEKRGEKTRYQSTFQNRHFAASYRGLTAFTPDKGSFEEWSTERYCLYAQSKSGQLFRGEVQHPSWPLQTADYEIETNTMLDAFPVGQMHPSVLYSKQLPVAVWWPARC